MNQTKVKWAILGTSPISETIADAIQQSSIAELAVIAGRTAPKAKAFSEKFSISTAYDNYQAALDDPSVQIVYIGLPNPLHTEWIIRCAQAGKHILCEKPLVTSAEDIHAIRVAVEKAKVFCMEALMYRSHPMINKLIEIIHNRMIGQVRSINAVYMADIAHLENPISKSALYNLGCYPVSLVRLVAATALNKDVVQPLESVSVGHLASDGCDTQASLLLKFENNITAMITTADDIGKFAQFTVYGTEGRLETSTNPWMPDQDNNTIMIYRHDEKLPFEVKITAEKPLYTYQIDILSEAVINGVMKEGISLEDSLGNAAILETWAQQIKDKKYHASHAFKMELLS